MNHDSIIAIARAQVGTKFRHQGRIPGQFLDCAGLVAHVAHELGVEYNELPGYGRIPHNGLMESVLNAQPCLKQAEEKQPGDILLMRFTQAPQHVAIYTGDTIIHSFSLIGKVCEHRLDELWESRIVAVYRFIGLTDER